MKRILSLRNTSLFSPTKFDVVEFSTMEEARPTKRVRFQEPARDPSDANSLECELLQSHRKFSHPGNPSATSNSMSYPTRSPSALDIYRWTNTDKATAPCFIRDVLSMRECVTEGRGSNFYWLGHIPCRTVLIIGVVVGIEVSERWTMYTVDDSTAVIDCMLRHPPPYGNLNTKAMSTEAILALRKRPLPPPPLPVTAHGYPVEVVGKVVQFHGIRQINAISIKACESTNDQWKHFKTVAELHKSKYAVPKPFEIPVEADSHDLRSPKSSQRPPPQPSSPLTHSAASQPSNFIVPDSTGPPKFLHPSQLRTADLTDDTFLECLHHYLHHASGIVPQLDNGLGILTQDWTLEVSTFPAFTLSYLRRVPELALLANRVVYAEMRRRTDPNAGGGNANRTRKSFTSRFSDHPRVKMKNLFMWAVLQLYEEGSIVLHDTPLALSVFCDSAGSNTASSSAPSDAMLSSALFSCPGVASSMSTISADDGYLSDPPPCEEDEAYVPVTPALLVTPVREIMLARGIKGKSPRVRVEDIARDLKRLDNRWARIDLEDVEEAIQLIELD
ncbi:hypothetical protein BDR05DRAFT_1006164 [Suillus weaverae]|nr:hypothetical protein BDR05DRAFT_1006164 [Suillus weaverae]